jgi:hypothetical protein
MNFISNCNFFRSFKKEYVFISLIALLMLFSFLGSNMIMSQSSSYPIEGYSDKIETQAQAQVQAQEQVEQTQAQSQEKQQHKDKQQSSFIKEGLLYDYNDGIYTGVPKSQIPVGQESLYIPKSQVIPPVCPECPPIDESFQDDDDSEKCPPCTPCKRCPEPAFMCKEIPSDSSNPTANTYLPRPVLTDFSEFGM